MTKKHVKETTTKEMKNEFSEEYVAIVTEINDLVTSIQSKVKLANPENLMNYLVSMNFLILINKETERDFNSEENFQLRSVEYIQSVLVSTLIQQECGVSEDAEEKLYGSILYETIELYKKMQLFYFYWGLTKQQASNVDGDTQEYIVFSQLMSQVRGTQYQVFRIEILKQLLKPHESEIVEAYGIDAKQLIDGLTELEKSLSVGKLDALKRIGQQMDELEMIDLDDVSEKFLVESQSNFGELIGLDLYDIKKVTNWPDELIE